MKLYLYWVIIEESNSTVLRVHAEDGKPVLLIANGPGTEGYDELTVYDRKVITPLVLGVIYNHYLNSTTWSDTTITL